MAPPAVAAPPQGFASPEIAQVWQRDDGPVASQRVSRPWLWGPGPFYTDYEPRVDTPQGNHLVQYFDKGRLEINDTSAPRNSPWYVTSGLLVKEMVSGFVQSGDGKPYTLGPANIAVAGDTDGTNTPTYAHFAAVTGRDRNRQGQYLSSSVIGAQPDINQALTGVQLARYEEASGNNWADVFWRFANSPDRPAKFDWLYTLGYPITGPYWMRATIRGKPQMVLVQLFERRLLTYNPSNPVGTQVEMGNVGRHYFNWRYANRHEVTLNTKYNARIAVGPVPLRLTTVVQDVELTNNTDKPLKSVVLRVAWNNWPGVLTLGGVTAQGAAAGTRWLHGINLEVALPAPAPPGGKVSLSINFNLKPRPVGGRTGYNRADDILGLGDMLPTVVPWENGGWSYYPYSKLGDLGYYAASDYEVALSSTNGEKLVAGGTGEVAGVSPDRSRWVFKAKAVRDVAYVVSPRFVNPLDDPSMRREAGGVRVLGLFRPEHRAEGKIQLDLVAPALQWASKNIGPYPHATYTVAEMGAPLERTDNYAQEYPTLYLVPASWLNVPVTPGAWTWYVPVHEVIHQWFYSAVGSNQLIDPWLDEALTTYVTAEYVRLNYPAQYARSWASMTGNASSARPVSAGVFSGFANEEQYTAAIYDRGTLMLDQVRRAMGDASFYRALQDYHTRFAGKRAKPADLLRTLQGYSSADLKPIFAEHLGY